MLSTFPILKAHENTHGSLIWAAFANRKKRIKKTIRTLKKGMQSLTDKLACHLQGNIELESDFHKLEFLNSKIILHINERKVEVDHIFLAIPANNLLSIFKQQSEKMASLFEEIPSNRLAVVNIGYNENVLKYKGFGYLVPSNEQQDILGVIWDSSAFPEQSASQNETRLSVMIGGGHCKNFPADNKEAIDMALRGVRSHLNIDQMPDAICVKIIQNAIPQYNVGHSESLKAIEAEIKALSPKITLLCNSFYGISLNDSVGYAKKIAYEYCCSHAV